VAAHSTESDPSQVAEVGPTSLRRWSPGRAWLRAPATEAILIAWLALTLNLAGNGRTSLWDRDEPRYAGCAREMRASGDYIHPTFNAEPRYHKPILTYWLMQAGVFLGGDNSFGNRLVSSLMGAGTCLLVWGLGRRMFGPNAGRIAALVMATAPIVVIESKLATTDATLLFFLTFCQWAMWELGRAPSVRWAYAFWASLALATLTKGPVAPGVIAVSALVAWPFGGASGAWRRLHWRGGLLLFAAIAAPWFIIIGVITRGEFYEVAMGRHVLERMTTGLETHGGFPGYYVLGSLVGFYPWSALLPAALLAAWTRRRSGAAPGFAAGWIVGPLVVLELIRTKLIHYYLPAYAGAALLVGWFLDVLIGSEVSLRRWPLGRLAMALLLGVGLASSVALAAAAFVVPADLRLPCVVLSGLIAAGLIVTADRLYRADIRRAVVALGASSAAVLLLLGGWALPAAEPYRLAPRVAARLRELCHEAHAKPLLAGFQPPAVVYYFGEPIAEHEGDDWTVDFVRRSGTVVAALTGWEARAIARDRRLVVELRESMRGFNVERGRDETLRLVLIRPAPVAGRAEARAEEAVR
jgi:4-amino-4-deoxy-L-arabinose transferase-like glycosyltransferase